MANPAIPGWSPENGIEVTVTDDSPPSKPVESVQQTINRPANTATSNSPGSFNINTFISDIRNRGVVKSHSFMVNIIPPKVIRNQWSDSRNILIRCEGASLPAVNFQMGELFRHGYGGVESMPHNVQFEPINLMFLLDGNAEIYTFWYKWMNGILNFNRSSGLNTPDENNKRPYEMAYKDDYATEIKILIYNEAADAIIQATLNDAFPIGIPDIPLNWSSTNELIKINIPISYRDFYAQTTFADSARNVSTFLSSTLPNNQLNKNSIRDNFSTLGFGAPGKLTSKLDRLVADILLG